MGGSRQLIGANGCDYCLAARDFSTDLAKIYPEEIALNRQGRSGDHRRMHPVRFGPIADLRVALTPPSSTARRPVGIRGPPLRAAANVIGFGTKRANCQRVSLTAEPG
jgi:hypothetical protein